MSSLLYSRYIPPKRTKVAFQDASTSPLVASEATPYSTQNTPHGPTSFRQDSPQQASTELTSSSSSKTLKRKRKNDDHSLNDQKPRLKRNEGHKSLLLKRDRSAKKAEKLTEPTSIELEEKTTSEATTILEETTEVHPLESLPQPRRVSVDPYKATVFPLPEWLRSPITVSATTTAPFTELGIPAAASKILESRGFPYAFAIQVALLRLLAPGNRQQRGDVLVSASTGSGKTLGYVLPMISEMSKMSTARLRGVIIVPTRDLAYQVGAVCQMASSIFSGKERRRVQYEVACGSKGYKNELFDIMDAKTIYNPVEYEKRKNRQVSDWDSLGYNTHDCTRSNGENLSISSRPGHIINYTFKGDLLICTPGRLVQHLLHTDGFNLNFINYIVIDEADRLLAQSYQQFIKLVTASVAKGRKRQVTKVILSATLQRDNLGPLNDLKLNKPSFVLLLGAYPGDVEVKPNTIYKLPDNLIEIGIRVKTASEKPIQLISMLHDMVGEPDAPRLGKGGVLVFTKTNEAAVRLACLISLLEPTIPVGTITSIIPASSRKKTVRDFDKNRLTVIIASDLASRGLDLPSLRYVINYDMPANLETYIHRVGRTARAGKEGFGYTLFEGAFESSQWKTIVNSVSVAGERNITTEVASPECGDEFMDRYQAALETLARKSGKA